jgi:glycosyltransferase involved in cell wall biosynthesis
MNLEPREPALDDPRPADHPDVSVVIPCFNEADSLAELHREVCAAFDVAGTRFEVVYVDDGSTDRTPQVLADLFLADDRVEVIRLQRNSGKAQALSCGIRHARGRVICTLDADLQDDPGELPALVARVQSGDVDMIVGWKKKRLDPWTKRLPSKVFNWVVRRVSAAPLHDYNCGLKVFRRDAAAAMPLYGELHRFMPVFAAEQGFTVVEEVVNHRPRVHGRSKYGAARFVRGFLDLFTVLLLTRYRYRPAHLFGGLGTLLSIAGLVVLLYLTVLWFLGESIGQRPLLIFGVLLFLTGLQGLGIGLVAEMIGHARSSGDDDSGSARRLRTHRERVPPRVRS